MKKLLLTLVLAIIFAFTTFAQSFIGQSSYYIKNSVRETYGASVKSITKEDNVMSIAFDDGHTGVYILNDASVCKYYCLCYNTNTFGETMVSFLNQHYDKVAGERTWWEKVESNYVYYKIIEKEKVFWLVVYPDFYADEAAEIIKML